MKERLGGFFFTAEIYFCCLWKIRMHLHKKCFLYILIFIVVRMAFRCRMDWISWDSNTNSMRYERRLMTDGAVWHFLTRLTTLCRDSIWSQMEHIALNCSFFMLFCKCAMWICLYTLVVAVNDVLQQRCIQIRTWLPMWRVVSNVLVYTTSTCGGIVETKANGATHIAQRVICVWVHATR